MHAAATETAVDSLTKAQYGVYLYHILQSTWLNLSYSQSRNIQSKLLPKRLHSLYIIVYIVALACHCHSLYTSVTKAHARLWGSTAEKSEGIRGDLKSAQIMC